MPFIPDYKPVQGVKNDAAPSLGAAMAPGKAIQSIGNAISDVGDDLSDYHGQLTRARDAGVRSAATLQMQQAFQEHEEYRARNPDESTWEADIQQRVSKARDSIFQQPMSALMKTELEAQMQTWEQDRVHNTRMDSLKQARARSRQHITNAAEAYIQAGDFESARKTIESGRGTVYLPEETDADLNKLARDEQDFKKKQAYQNDIAAIEQDPFSARAIYESPTPPDGADPIEYARKRDHFRSTLAREQNSIIDSIRDGIASGKILTADQLDEYEDELGAAAVSTLKAGMARSFDETRKAQIAAPDAQAQIIGRVSSAIDALDPKDIDSRVRIEQDLSDIAPGPTKNQLSAELSRKIGGEPPQPGPMRNVRAMLNDAYKAGYFGPVETPPEQTTADVVADDFLQDAAKLQALGFSQDQIDAIQNPEISREKQLFQFRQLYPSRDAAKTTADDYTQRAARALIERRQTVPRTEEEKARSMRDSIKALQRKGEIEKGLLEWQQDHPDGDLERELFRRLGDAESSSFLDSLDGGEWFPTDATGSTTNPTMPAGFGMASDTLLPPK